MGQAATSSETADILRASTTVYEKVAGWEKYEKKLELSEMLEQNFLIYDDKGDVPSQIHSYLSSNFQDLRNLAKDDPKLDRRRRWLVRSRSSKRSGSGEDSASCVDERVTTIPGLKAQLKTVRTEALQAGFKDCWQDNGTTRRSSRWLIEYVMRSFKKIPHC